MNLKGVAMTLQLLHHFGAAYICCGQYSLSCFMDFSEPVNFSRLNGLTLLFPTQMSINLQQIHFKEVAITVQIFSTGLSTCPIREMTLYSKLVRNNNALLLWSSGQEGLIHWHYSNLTKPYVVYFRVTKSTIRILLIIVFELVRPLLLLLLLLGCQLG